MSAEEYEGPSDFCIASRRDLRWLRFHTRRATRPSMAANALVIFAKWPWPGQVKTRLCIEGGVVYVDVAG